MDKKQLYPLELFNEKFEELKRSGFIKNWQGKKVSYSFDLKTDELEQVIPNDDEVKSFILTLRFFIQDNESSSIRRLEKHYANLEIPDKLFSEFKVAKKELNDFLDTGTHFGAKDKHVYTHRDIFDNYIYGHFAHANDQKRNTVKKWNESNFLGSQTAFFLINILYNLFFLLKKVKKINVKTITHFQNN